MRKLFLYVTYTTKPGMREEFIREVLSSGVLEKIYQEKGCLGYKYYYSVSSEDEILLMEQWETEEHQKLHLEQPHMEKLKTLKNRYVIDTHIEKSFWP